MDKKYAEKSIFRSKFCAPDRSATEQIWLSSSVNIQRNRREMRAACLILHFGGKKKEKPSSVYVRTTPFERGKECLVFASPTTMVQFPNSQQAPKSTFLNWKRPYSSTLHPSPPLPLLSTVLPSVDCKHQMPAVCCPVFRLTDSLNRPQGVPLPFSLTGPRLERKVYIRTRTGPPSPTPSQALPPQAKPTPTPLLCQRLRAAATK